MCGQQAAECLDPPSWGHPIPGLSAGHRVPLDLKPWALPPGRFLSTCVCAKTVRPSHSFRSGMSKWALLWLLPARAGPEQRVGPPDQLPPITHLWALPWFPAQAQSLPGGASAYYAPQLHLLACWRAQSCWLCSQHWEPHQSGLSGWHWPNWELIFSLPRAALSIGVPE